MFTIISDSDKSKVFKKYFFQKNQIIFHENQECEMMGIIISGEFIIQSFSFNGNEMTYAYLKEGDIFGQNLIFSKHNTYKGNVICLKSGEVHFINKNDLLYIFNKYPKILSNYLEKQSNSIISLNNSIKILTFENAEERFLFFLSNNGKYQYESITKLAKILNLRRETLSRLITKLIKKDIIAKDQNYIYLK
jgi:CRP-like cAMP-binding protein